MAPRFVVVSRKPPAKQVVPKRLLPKSKKRGSYGIMQEVCQPQALKHRRSIWCRGYYVDTVGKDKKAIAEHIRNQLQEDLAYEQMSIKELVDPFTGEPG